MTKGMQRDGREEQTGPEGVCENATRKPATLSSNK